MKPETVSGVGDDGLANLSDEKTENVTAEHDPPCPSWNVR